MAGLDWLAKALLEAPTKFLRRGTRPLPFSKQQLTEDAANLGVTIRAAKPLGIDAESEIVFRTKAPSKSDPNVLTPVDYRLRKFKPENFESAFAADTLGESITAKDLDPRWVEHFIRQAPPNRRLSVLNALGSEAAQEGTGTMMYPLVMDYQMLDPGAMNLVTGLTKDNVNRWAVNQIPQYLRTGGLWAEKSIPPLDLFADPVTESLKDPAGRLASLLSLHLSGTTGRIGTRSPLLLDSVMTDALSPLEAAGLIRKAGIGQVGPHTVQQIRGIQSALDGDEASALRMLEGSFRKGGPVRA